MVAGRLNALLRLFEREIEFVVMIVHLWGLRSTGEVAHAAKVQGGEGWCEVRGARCKAATEVQGGEGCKAARGARRRGVQGGEGCKAARGGVRCEVQGSDGGARRTGVRCKLCVR
jgi:hypothetical protein